MQLIRPTQLELEKLKQDFDDTENTEPEEENKRIPGVAADITEKLFPVFF